VYGAGRGPASRWIEVYRRCLQAGKSVQVLAETAQDALTVLEAVGAKGVWLTIGEGFGSVEEAEAFLREVERRTA
jgi:homoserine trans-succinylase